MKKILLITTILILSTSSGRTIQDEGNINTEEVNIIPDGVTSQTILDNPQKVYIIRIWNKKGEMVYLKEL